MQRQMEELCGIGSVVTLSHGGDEGVLLFRLSGV